MHLNYYFLKRLSNSLRKKLTGFEAVEIFSQNKDELILSFLKDKEEFHIKALLSPQFSCLAFMDDFARAKRNSIDLFQELIGLTVIDIHQFTNERSFSIKFENGFQLLFKMHGKRANIIFFKEDTQIALFNNQMKFDLSVKLSELERPLDQSENSFEKHQLDIFPTFGKHVLNNLYDRGYSTGNPDNWKILQQLLSRLELAISIYNDEQKGTPILTLLDVPHGIEPLSVTTNALEAANDFYYQYTKVDYLRKEKDEYIRNLMKKLRQTESYLKKTTAKLDDIEKNSRHQEIADILMANLHHVPSNKKEVTLFDFYRNQEITIKIKTELSAQKNAENYYRKSKNQKIEVAKLYENIFSKEEEKQEIENSIAEISEVDSLKVLRKLTKSNDLTNHQKKPEIIDAFKRVTLDGWLILIGRNAKNNDLLTQKYANKNDLWLHAKDVSGSHVVIKQKPGSVFPKHIIEKAAQLAAYYSKRKTDTLCPVSYTLKKYVRKPKGFIPGQVVVDREEIILVEPKSIEGNI